MSLRPDRIAGELRSREQQIGEYVPEVDAQGRDIPEKNSPFRERHELTKRKRRRDPEIAKTKQALKSGPRPALTRHRLKISKIARRKPVPSMRLANYEYRDVIKEHNENKSKSKKQKEEEQLEQVKEYWARKKANLPLKKPRREPFKHPANL